MSSNIDTVHLYWATGCTSCLRAKEFLERNNVDFQSHNIMEDSSILDDMEAQGMPPQVPIIQRGNEWAHAQQIENVAELGGVEHEADLVPVDELYRRLNRILTTLQDYTELFTTDHLTVDIPNRPRSIGELTFHAFSIPEMFLEHEDNPPLNSPIVEPEWANRSPEALRTYGEHIQTRLRDWFFGPGQDRNWDERADVYYGNPLIHEFFERTTWHSGQHTRQLEWMITEEFDIDIEPLDPSIWEDLPMPKKIWDAQ